MARAQRSGRRATLQVAFVTYLGLTLSLVSTPVLVAALGASGRGQLGKSLILMQLFGMFLFLGVPRGLSVARSQGQGIYRPAVLATLCLGACGAVAVFVLSPVIADDSAVLRLARLSAVGMLLAGPGAIGGDIALAKGRFGLYNLWRGGPLIGPSLGIIVAGLSGHLTLNLAFGLNLIAILTSNAIGCIILMVSLVGSHSALEFNWAFSLKFWASTSADAVGYRADQLLGAIFLSSHSLGIYLVSFTIASASAGVTQSMNQVAYSRLLTGGLNEVTFVRLRRIISVSCGFLVTLATWLLAVPVFGSAFSKSWVIVGLLAVAQVFRDSWAWVVLRNAARSVMGGAQAVSVVSLASLLFALTLLGINGALTPISLGLSMIGYGALRIALFSGFGSVGARKQ